MTRTRTPVEDPSIQEQKQQMIEHLLKKLQSRTVRLFLGMTSWTDVVPPAGRYLRSSFCERLVEHVFISELLQEAWFRHGATMEVLNSAIRVLPRSSFEEVDGVSGLLERLFGLTQ